MREENEALNEQKPGFLEGRGCLLIGWCVYKHNPLNCAIAPKARVAEKVRKPYHNRERLKRISRWKEIARDCSYSLWERCSFKSSV